MAQLLTISGQVIKTPNKFAIEKYYLSKAGRTSDGMMHIDKIANKRKFIFNYTILSGSEVDKIKNIIYEGPAFFNLLYKENDKTYTVNVYSGAITAEQYRTDTGAWYWKNVAFDLIER